MSQKKVVIEFEADGSSRIDAQGFVGQSCAVATRELELVLAGGSMAGVDDKKKPEYALRPQSGMQTQRN